MSEQFLVNAKAYVALVGAIATALSEVYVTGTVGHVLTVICVVTTAVATWATPNRSGSDNGGAVAAE